MTCGAHASVGHLQRDLPSRSAPDPDDLLATPAFAFLSPGYLLLHPRPINERMWFGRIVASYRFTSGGSDAISTATLATSCALIT